MQLLVIRHAIAEDREEFAVSGQDDDLRPLTREGRRRMRRAARGLRGLVPELGILAASPLLRAAQTADILSDAYGGLERATWPELAPGVHPSMLVDRLRSLRAERGPVAVVGHEPDLGELVSWLLSGRTPSFVDLKKGAACLLEFEGPPDPERARLLWLLAPGHLRRLGE
ncbi:MAG TPA: phosphohistidine phosphatase SixA [Longimicrobiaceae bacterium]|nr:phosphohistidine phosphatase SixA [Longimicrobiaceae bacterium]